MIWKHRREEEQQQGTVTLSNRSIREVRKAMLQVALVVLLGLAVQVTINIIRYTKSFSDLKIGQDEIIKQQKETNDRLNKQLGPINPTGHY